MMNLAAADRFCLQAALGWLELGNPTEAEAELASLSAAMENHPAVLEIRWQIAAQQKQWEKALEAARRQLQQDPTRVSGYLHQAYALRRVKNGGLEKARAALLPAARVFPEVELVHYNLACYEAQLGRLEEAWEHFQQALKVSEDSAQLLRHSLLDEDLKPLWDLIKNQGH